MTAAAVAASRAEPASGDGVSLVQAAQRGDRSAFAQLYGQYARAVHGILLTLVPFGEVEDLVQDVFLTAMERLPSLREPAAFGSWLAAMARNRAVDYFRRAPRKTTELVDDMAITQPDREARAILAIIRSLPGGTGETLMLRLVEGTTGPEIAAATGLTEGRCG
jgi:RNA polymerase sigma-70 factor (ECF subfamily)